MTIVPAYLGKIVSDMTVHDTLQACTVYLRKGSVKCCITSLVIEIYSHLEISETHYVLLLKYALVKFEL